MKRNAALLRDVLLRHGTQSVRVTEEMRVEIEFPDDKLERVPSGVVGEEVRGEWRVMIAGD